MKNRAFEPNPDWVSMVTVSHWYDDLFQNWLQWFMNLQLEMDLILVAEDLFTFEKYFNSSYNVLYFGMKQVRPLRVESN